MWSANSIEAKYCGLYFKINIADESLKDLQEIHTKVEVAYQTKEFEKLSLLLREESKGLEKVSKHFQQLKEHLPASKTCFVEGAENK